jgi:hypothetical protein
MCVTLQVNSSQTNLFSSSWSPSPIGLSCFKVSALVSLCWGQKMLSSFLGVLPTLRPPLCALTWPKSNHLTFFFWKKGFFLFESFFIWKFKYFFIWKFKYFFIWKFKYIWRLYVGIKKTTWTVVISGRYHHYGIWPIQKSQCPLPIGCEHGARFWQSGACAGVPLEVSHGRNRLWWSPFFFLRLGLTM